MNKDLLNGIVTVDQAWMFRILLDKYVLAVQKHRYLKYLRFQKFSISTSLGVMSNFSGEGVQNPKRVMC